MPFAVEEFHDLIRLLETRPEWRADLRRLVLSEELLLLTPGAPRCFTGATRCLTGAERRAIPGAP